MYTISKRFTFSASHQLGGLVDGHPCSRLHGHNYEVEVILASGGLRPPGFVVDYGDLGIIGAYLASELDHRHLNDVLDGNPTAERIAERIYDLASAHWPETVAVRVAETPKTWAEYRR